MYKFYSRYDSSKVVFEGADLSGADLSGADLSGADLSEAYLSGAIGNMREVKSLQLDTYLITYTKDRLHIGCEGHSIKKWFEFSDEDISKMDDEALEWWTKYKDYIKLTIKLSPAVCSK